MSITMIGLDTAKSVFQVHARERDRKGGDQAQAAKERTDPVLREAGGLHGRHGGVRRGPSLGPRLSGLGHEVKLIAPEAVKPFVKKGKKNDAADAAATLRSRIAARHEVRAGQKLGAAGHPGLAFGPIPAGQAADDAGERHARPGDRIRPDRPAGYRQARGAVGARRCG